MEAAENMETALHHSDEYTARKVVLVACVAPALICSDAVQTLGSSCNWLAPQKRSPYCLKA